MLPGHTMTRNYTTTTAVQHTPPGQTDFEGVSARVLEKAEGIVGGREQLAAQLRVKLTDLQTWMLGDEIPPHKVFEDAIEIIISAAERERKSRAIATKKP